MRNLILFLCFLVSGLQAFCQNANPAIDTSDFRVGGEIKGMNVGGSIAILGGLGIGTAVEVLSDNGRTGIAVPLISAGLAVAPASLVGFGIGSLLAKNHSRTNGSFQIGVGMTFSPVFMRHPPFPDGQPKPRYVSGLNIRLQSKEIDKWRYNLGFNHFFVKTYEFNDQQIRKSWQSVNLDLQYLFHVTPELKVYPLVGTQFLNFMGDQLYTNYGAGFNFEFLSKFNLYGEVKYSLDPDQVLNQRNYGIGILLDLD